MKRVATGLLKFQTVKMKSIVLILFLSSCQLLLYGQTLPAYPKGDTDCNTVLTDADRLFQDGLYDKCISLIEGVLKNCELSKGEKALALELLAKAYLETDDPGKAETAVNLMLKNRPHYELKERENFESFNRLVKKYKVHPLFSIGLRNTLDWMNYKTTKIFYVDGLHYDEPYKKKLEGILNDFNWAYYGWAELEFDGGISLNADLIFKWTNFVREMNTPAFKLTFKEQDNYIEIPLYLKKYFYVDKYVLPYVTAGVGWLYMTKATGNATKGYLEKNRPSETTGDVNMLDMRNISTFEWIAGAGVGYKMKNLRLFVDIRYYGGLNSITNPEKSLINNSVVSEYLYVDNYVRFNQFELGASFSYTLFNSVKRTRH
jgi:hypothetical protein